MPSWLVEDPSPTYVVLLLVALAFAGAFWMKRKRIYLVGVLAVLLLIGLVWLLGRLIVSDRAQIATAIHEITDAVGERNVDKAFAHIARDFQWHGMPRGEFQKRARTAIERYGPTEGKSWDVEFVEVDREKRSAKVEFLAKVKGSWSSGAEHYRVRAEFTLEPDGKWRLRTFELFNPLVEKDQPMSIPGI